MAGLLNNSRIFLILLVSLVGCTTTVTKEESFVIVDTWQEYPVSVHQEISPRNKALLNNGDTVPCSSNAKIGDTVYYKYCKK